MIKIPGEETSMPLYQILNYFLACSLYSLYWTLCPRIQRQFGSGIYPGYISVIFFQLLFSNWRAPNVHHYHQWLRDYAASWPSFSKMQDRKWSSTPGSNHCPQLALTCCITSAENWQCHLLPQKATQKLPPPTHSTMLFFQLVSTYMILILEKSYPFMILSFRSINFFMLDIENLLARSWYFDSGLIIGILLYSINLILLSLGTKQEKWVWISCCLSTWTHDTTNT